METTNKIATIAFVLPNLGAGGAERVMITIANHLDRQRFKPVIIAFDKKGPLIDLIAKDIEVIGLGAKQIRTGAKSFIRTIRTHKPDVILSTMAHLNFLVLLLKPFLKGTPIIVREAITPSYFKSRPLKRLILNFGYCFLYPTAAKIISPTQIVFDEMPKMLRQRKDKLARHFNPVDAHPMRADINLDLRKTLAAPHQKLFVAAGRLVHQKGFDRLIESLQPWAHRDDWRLVILGEGPDHILLQDMINHSNLNQITLAGFEGMPWRYYAVADAFLLPSRHEGLPNVALEALAMGTKIIAADSAGGITEIAKEASSGTVQLATTMREFVSFMENIEILASHIAKDSLLPQSFSLQHIVSEYEQTFEDALKKSRA